MKIFFLIITSYDKNFFKKVFSRYKKECDYKIYDPKKNNEKKFFLSSKKNFNYLISFANGYIFSKKFLSKFDFYKRINFHPGTPNYPGRAAHHFACYKGEQTYGGTMHIMTSKVDNGPILDIKKIKIKSKNKNYEHFQKAGFRAIEILLKKNLEKIINDKLKIRSELKWSKRVYTRNDFLSMLKVKENISKKNFFKLIKSFYTKDRKSLYIKLHNKLFFLKLND